MSVVLEVEFSISESPNPSEHIFRVELARTLSAHVDVVRALQLLNIGRELQPE